MKDTIEQLRADIDSGRTGDKNSWPDPAAAPLGTDEESGGQGTDPNAAALARAQELRPDVAHEPQRGIGHAWILIGFILVFAGVFSLAALMQL
jgi:hypothetical protein